ncbi:MAG: signal peptidase I [Acidimicrobiales bacterium]|jgi:signal peptidase I
MAGIIAAAAVLFGVWIFFAPTKLGGTTTYSITDGISMNPLLYKGDLAVIRSQSIYHVGDVVLYQSQVLHKPVLHRIILIQNGNYFFKGDNNDFVDPGYATRSELIGKLWFHIPHAGAVLGWFGVPAHASLLAGIAAMAVVLTGAKTSKGGRRRRGRSPPRQGQLSHTMTRESTPSHANELRGTGERRSATGSGSEKTRPEQERRSGIVMTPQQVAARRAPSYFEGPKSTLIALCILALLAVVFLGVGYSRPLLRTAPLTDAYRQTGTFSYSAAVNAPTAVYPSGAVKTGDPIYPSLVSSLGLNFKYQFASPLPHHVTGTIQLRTLVLSSTNTWKSLSTGTATAPFTGDTASVSTTLALSGLYALINTVSAQSGVAGANYAVDVQPVVRITGTVAGNPIKATFLPVLPFQVAPTALTLDVPVAPAPPGATYVAPSAASALAAGLNPTQSGNVPHIYPNVVSVAKYEVRVSLLRTSGLIFAVLAVLVAVLHDVLRRRKTIRSDEELIARQVGSLIVPVDRLADTDGSARLVVLDFAHLAGLAHYLERPILYEMRDGQRRYEVDDETRRYVYQPASEMGTLCDVNGATGRAEEDSGLWSESDRQEHRAREVEAGAATL